MINKLISYLRWSGFIGLGFLLSTPYLYANPVVDNIASGSVSIQQTSTSTVVNQTSQKAIINWQSFNIGKNETTHFQQPAGGVVLNRISPNQGASAIYGRLTATGQVILINPAGIFFGPGSYVNVGGLVASTHNLTDQDFLNNVYHFQQVNGYNGTIINQGQLIAAEHGLIALIGGAVSNEGYIEATLGKIILASGKAMTMQFSGNDLISFSVDEKLLEPAMANGVNNTGILKADGGKILIEARAATGVLDNVINMEGVAQTQSIDQQQGEIILSSEPDSGVVRVAGTLDASGSNAGNVTITGYNILLDHSALINANDVLIGGNYQGKGPLPNANAVVMLPDATIFAKKAILWSDHYTSVKGSIIAKGGFVETSSHDYLDVNGAQINLKADNGTLGTWLLDPDSIDITTTADNLITGSSPFQPSPAGSNSTVTWATLEAALTGGTVIVQTASGNINIANSYDFSIANTATGTLELLSAADITANTGLTVTGKTGLSLWLNATGTTSLDTNFANFDDVNFQNATNSTYSGIISGSGSLTKNGSGILTLTNDSSYSGLTTINSGGTIQLGANGGPTNTPLGDNSAFVVVNSGGVLDLNGFSLGIAKGLTLNGTGIANGGALTNNSASSSTWSGIIVLGSSSSIIANTERISLTNSNPILGATFDLTLGGSAATASVISAAIDTTTGSVIKIGTTQWRLFGLGGSTYSGGTIIKEGTLSAGGNSNALGTGTITLGDSSGSANATLISEATSFTFNNLINVAAGNTGTATISVADFATDSTFSNLVTLNNHALTLSVDSASLTLSGNIASTSTANNLVLNINNSGAITLSGTSINPVGALSFTGAGSGIATVSGIIGTNVTSVTKNSSGTTTLSGVNTYSGLTTVSAGTLNLNTTGSNSISGNLTVSGGSAVLQQANQIANTATLTVSGGAFDIGSFNETIFSLVLSSGSITGTSGTLISTSVINAQSGTISAILGGSGGMTKSTSGTVTLSGANTYTGSTSVTAGTLNLNTTGANAISGNLSVATSASVVLQQSDQIINTANVAITGGTFDIGSFNETVNIFSLSSGTVSGTSGVLSAITTFNVLSGNMNASLSGTANLLKVTSGLVTLSKTNTYSGTTTITTGILQLGSGGVGGTLGTGAVIDNATLSFNNSNNLTISNNISGSGEITKLSTGTATLSGNNSYNGNTTVLNGTLIANSNTALGNSPSVIVLSGATLQINNGVTITNPLLLFGSGVGGAGVLVGSGNATASGNISLVSSPVFSTLSSSDSLTLNGTINNATGLTLSGSGNIILGNTIGNTTPLTSITSSAPTFISASSIKTSGSQTYNNSVTLNNDTQFILNGSGTDAITFNGNVTGGFNLTLSGSTSGTHQFILNSALALNNLTVSSGAGSTNNVLTLHNGSAQNWTINSTDAGNISGLSGVTGTASFNNIQNINAGISNDNTFTFADGATLTGALNAGSLSHSTTLNLSAYSTPVGITLSSIAAGSGTATNSLSSTIANFTNINNLTTNTLNNSLTLANELNDMTITNAKAGFINDPVYFTNFQTINSGGGTSHIVFNAPTTLIFSGNTAIATINGTTMYFVGFDQSAFSNYTIPTTTTTTVNVANVIQQSMQPASTTSSSNQLSSWDIMNMTVDENLDTLVNQQNSDYENNIEKLNVVANCFEGAH